MPAPKIRICQGPDCTNKFEWSGIGRPKSYCSPRCATIASEMRKYGPKGIYPTCLMDGCEDPVLPPKTKYCTALHQRRQKMRNQRNGVVPSERVLRRKGPRYVEFLRRGFGEKIKSKELKRTDVAKIMGLTDATISRYHSTWEADMADQQLRRGWSGPQSSMGLTYFLEDKDVDELVEQFIEFRDKYFRTGQGHPYFTSAFHVSWITAILQALKHGGELQILSPPRHGKTDLMIHFAVWLIVHVPNIRIMWVGGNEDIAQDAVSACRDHLDENEDLVHDFLGPGRTFKPESRSGKAWSSTRFTVASRTVTGVKSPTMVAVGRGGKILSRDVDLIVCDDIEDHGSTIQPGSRQNTRNWMTTTVGSRKEEHTAIVVIGSRQHVDDLYAHLLDNPGWEKIVEEAHDSSCELDPEVFDIHVACMLFPEMRTYRWLMSRLTNALTTGGKHIYEMVYLNKAVAAGMEIFKKPAIEQCQDLTRKLGEAPQFHSLYLCAGLDPAATGYQAAFLWGFDFKNELLYKIDSENQKGGGIEVALEQMQDWYNRYNVKHWVIERNLFHGGIKKDPRVKKYAASNGIYLEEHQTTAQSKWDDTFGITTMAPLFENSQINLPYADTSAQQKTDVFKRQLINFASDVTPTGKRRKMPSDLVMAAWFPLKVFRRKIKEQSANMQVQYEQSFSGWDRTNWNEAPW